MANEKKMPRVKGFSNNGVEWPGQSGFDTDYLNLTIVKKVKKVGAGDEDYVIVEEAVYEKTPIQEVLDADADSVGVYNIIKQVLRTGDTSLLPADNGGNFDLVDAPESLMELKQLGEDAAKKFGALPGDLTKGLDMKNFVETLTQEQFDAFIKAIADRANPVKDEVKDNG